MPELPEVETICRNLLYGAQGSPALVGMRVQDAQVFWARSLETPTVEEFLRRLPGQVVQGVRRRGKFIVIQLSQDALLIHLRMSGDLRVEAQELPLAPHDRCLVNFTDGLRLVFDDTRKFGRLWLVADPQSVLGNLGPEPLDETFTADELFKRLQASRRQIKPLLMDQRFLAGLGNIYTDEALHRSCLYPLLLSSQVSAEEAGRLWAAIRSVLEEGIRRNGASIDWVYRGGDFQNYFRVYQRTGQPCPVCGTAIQRMVVGQRGTHFCPYCQPAMGGNGSHA
jgi:formamidopyrimidine-DNA glycosylase